jgi:hypothetical protein
VTDRGGDVLGIDPLQEMKRSVSDAGDRLRRRALADAASVLPQGHVTDVVEVLFTMSQWPREIARGLPAQARSRPKLVAAQTVSVVVLPLTRRVRSSRQTCFTPGQSRYPVSRVAARIRRASTRPWSLPWASARSSSVARLSSSRGGKIELSPASRLIVEGEIALSPTTSPESYGVGVKFHDVCRRDIGQGRVLSEQQDQSSPLRLGERDGSATD